MYSLEVTRNCNSLTRKPRISRGRIGVGPEQVVSPGGQGQPHPGRPFVNLLASGGGQLGDLLPDTVAVGVGGELLEVGRLVHSLRRRCGLLLRAASSRAGSGVAPAKVEARVHQDGAEQQKDQGSNRYSDLPAGKETFRLNGIE